MSVHHRVRRPSIAISARSDLAVVGPSLIRRQWASLRGSPTHGSGDATQRALDVVERLDALARVADRLARARGREDLLRTIVEETREAMQAGHALVRVAREDRLELAAWAGLTSAAAAELPDHRPSDGRIDGSVRTGRAVAIDDDLVAPMAYRDRIIGTLAVGPQPDHGWADQDAAFLTALATHASSALAGAELFGQAEARAAQLALLQSASHRMSRATTIEGVGRIVVEETARIIDYHNARVYVLEPPDQLVPVAFEGRVGAYEQVDMELLRCRLGEGFTGWVALHGEPLLINDANQDPRGQTIVGTDEVDESMLIVPMRYDDAIVGVITLSKLGLDGFDLDDQRILTILADQAASAMESARLLGRSQDLTGELRRLLEISGELSESLDPRQVANLMARHLAGAMAVDECAVSYWDRETGRLESLGFWPALEPDEMQPYFDVSSFPETLRALERQETIIVDTEAPTADPAEVELLVAQGMRTVVMLPFIAKGQAIGLVELFSRSPGQWAEERLELARTMANEGAMALENARLYEEARRLADRDPVTGFFNHRYLQERVGEEVVRARRSRRPLSVLMLDLDDFKLVNDTFGHLFGDNMLKWAAELIRSTLRGSDVAARYGGDEFAVILPETGIEEARHAAERILAAFRDQPYPSDQRGPIPLATSIGAATFPDHGRTATELIAAADGALYAVKRAGGTMSRQHRIRQREIDDCGVSRVGPRPVATIARWTPF